MINQYSKYIRMAATVSDEVYLDEVKAVVFATEPANDAVVSELVNSDNPYVVDMINTDTFTVVAPGQDLNQANVVAFVTTDSTGNAIQFVGSYFAYIVSKNRGGYQLVRNSSS